MILGFEISLLGLVVKVLDVFLALVPEVLTKLSLLGVFGNFGFFMIICVCVLLQVPTRSTPASAQAQASASPNANIHHHEEQK